MAADMLIDRAQLFTLTTPATTLLFGGFADPGSIVKR
jgi:catalase (peroxidase I)